MQFHYVVGFDSNNKRWWVEWDTEAYFPDGHVWDEELDRKGEYGWTIPEDGSITELIDQRCMNMLNALTPIWPAVDTEA